MSARTRQAAPAVACAHEADRRDCGACVAEAHAKAVDAARAVVFVVPDDAKEPALDRHRDAVHAREGHRLLWMVGIPLELPAADWRDVCRACGFKGGSVHVVCRNSRCPGRRVRCELPAVRR